MKQTSAIEFLESRIAPATVLPGGRSISYMDVDGDLVTVTVSKGTLTANHLAFDTAFADNGPQQLQTLTLLDPQFAGAVVSIVAKSVNGAGNGLANVGFIQAKDIDLASVKVTGDLGRIAVGDTDPYAPGLKSLSVNSMGFFGTSTQANGGTLRSFFYGGLGQISVTGDLRHAELNTLNADGQDDAGFGNITIGGSLIGGSATFSGQIYSEGKIGLVKIGGDIVGGSAASTGQISAGGSIAGISIGGSLRGGSYDSPTLQSSAGAIVSGRDANSGGDVGFIKIGKSLIGGEGELSGQIVIGNISAGSLKALFVGGDIAGGSGASSGQLTVSQKAGKVEIAGSLIGGSQAFAGRLNFNEVGSLVIKGNVLGGSGLQSAWIKTAGGRAITILGSIVGGGGSQSASIFAPNLPKVSVGGSIIGGDGPFSGSLNTSGKAGAVNIKGSILDAGRLLVEVAKTVTVGGDLAPGLGENSESGKITANDIGALSIKGSIKTGTTMSTAAAVSAFAIKTLTIGGSVIGTASGPALIAINGLQTDSFPLENFTVKGRFEQARLVIGNGALDGLQVKNIVIGGDFIASAIAVGTTRGNDNLFGTVDDAFIDAGANPLSRIASLVIKGQACGTPGGTDSFGIFAERFGKVVVRGVNLPLLDASMPLGPTGDLNLRFAN